MGIINIDMKIAKVQSKVLTTALNEKRKEFSILSMYLGDFKIDGDCIISQYIDADKIELKDAVFDYCFNERESESLFSLAERILGKKIIDMNVIKIISI